MLRIEPLETRSKGATLRLEGRVIGPWVEELRRSCETILGQGRTLVVDLSGVSFIDRDGVDLFRHLRGRRVILENCSAFVEEQLKPWKP